MIRLNRFGIVASIVALSLAVGLIARAQDGNGGGATTQPSDSSDRRGDTPRGSGASSRNPRGLVMPWSRLTSLTSEQKQKIAEIHLKASADKKAIEDKETADIMALLTDEQKTELAKYEEERRAADKARTAERRRANTEKKDTAGVQDKDKEKEKDKGDDGDDKAGGK